MSDALAVARDVLCEDCKRDAVEKAARPNIEASIEVDLFSAVSPAMLEEFKGNLFSGTAAPARVPNALIPTRALFRRSSAILRFLSRVFLRMVPIFSVVWSFPSFSASSSVCDIETLHDSRQLRFLYIQNKMSTQGTLTSARIPSPFVLIPKDSLSDVLSTQWHRVGRSVI